MKTISHLVAVSNNLVIGVDNDLPWNLRADLAHFKKYTFNKIIIMGRKTFESIGKPLPNRINFVVSKTLNEIPGAYVFNNLDEAISVLEKAAALSKDGKTYVLLGNLYLGEDKLEKTFDSIKKGLKKGRI